MEGFTFACAALVVLVLALLWEKHASGLTWEQIIEGFMDGSWYKGEIRG